MGVITTVDKYDGELDVALSAKMVRTWRKKTKVEIGQDGISRSYPAWMRRSRLVGSVLNNPRDPKHDTIPMGVFMPVKDGAQVKDNSASLGQVRLFHREHIKPFVTFRAARALGGGM